MVLACCGMIICVMCAAVSEGRMRRLRPSDAMSKRSAGGSVGVTSRCVTGCSRHSASCHKKPQGGGKTQGQGAWVD